jgi:phytoene synthase
MSSETDEIERTVADGDPDRMATAFFAPSAVRAHLMSLYALNIELARVRDTVREPMAGQLRFAWWRDQLNRIPSAAKLDAPVGRALAAAVSAHALPLHMLQGLIDARSQELAEAPFATEADFVAHADATSGAIMRLAARICGAGDRADALAKPAGLAFARIGTLRALAHFAHHRHCYMPLDALSRLGIGPEDVFAGDMARLRPLVQDWAARAMGEIREARRHQIPRGVSAAVLPAVIARQYVPLLAAPDIDLFSAPPQLRRLTTAAALARAAWTGRV